jgi:hypothetical protein
MLSPIRGLCGERIPPTRTRTCFVGKRSRGKRQLISTHKKRIRLAGISALVVFLIAAGSPEPSFAEPKVTLTPASGPSGTQTTVRGAGFGARDRVVVRVGRKVVARPRTNRRGSFTASFRVGRRSGNLQKILSSSGRRRVVSFFRLANSPQEPAASEVALRSGTRLRSAPLQGPVASDLGLRGARFPARRRISITFGNVSLNAGRSSPSGTFSKHIVVPSLPVGRHVVRVRVGSKRLGFGFSITADPLIAAAGDIACDPESPAFNGAAGTADACHMRQTSDLILQLRPNTVLALGDTQYEAGTPPDFLASYHPTWGRFKDITRPVPGNHDYGHQNGSGYFAYFGAAAGEGRKGYYSFDVGAWHLVALNSNCDELGVNCGAGFAQERWLRADLARHQEKCVLAFMHAPLFSSGQGGGHPTLLDLVIALDQAKADVLLAGSDHDYERFAPQTPYGHFDPVNGIRQFVVGTGGRDLQGFKKVKPNSEVRNADTFGVLTLKLHPTSYEWEFVPEAGRSFSDRGSHACH